MYDKIIVILLFILFVFASMAVLEGANIFAQSHADDDQWIVYEGSEGVGVGKHIVLVSGDEEYRSEQMLPQLAKILAHRHGFKTTVLFAINPETGYIDPNYQKNIPGLEILDDADLMIIFTRFRALPDYQMNHIIDYLNAGKPIIGIRPVIAAFWYQDEDSLYAKYNFNSNEPGWEGGFSRRYFGETWRYHHGDHGSESSRALINGPLSGHPILTGVRDIWCPTDVYGIVDIEDVEDVLLYGIPLKGMEPDSPPNFDKSVMPVAWTKNYTAESGETGRSFFSTMGTSVTLKNEGFRRMLVNAAYWALEMENHILEKNDISLVGEYDPAFFGFYDEWPVNLKPSDFKHE